MAMAASTPTATLNRGTLLFVQSSIRLVDVRERDYVSGRLPAELWEITTEEWHARR